MFHQVNNSIIPTYLETIFLFMGYQSEENLRELKIDDGFFNDMNESITRILQMNTELTTKFRSELIAGGQDHQSFKIRSGHKKMLMELQFKLIEEKGKRKDFIFWKNKISSIGAELFAPADVTIHTVIWKTHSLCHTKCPVTTYTKTLNLRKYFDI